MEIRSDREVKIIAVRRTDRRVVSRGWLHTRGGAFTVSVRMYVMDLSQEDT